MKTIVRSFSLILLVAFAFSSCEKNSDTSKGTAKFSIASIEQSGQLKSTWADTALVSWHLLVSVEDADGSPVLTDHLVPVYLFGPGYISEELEMNEGDYRLTEFMLIDPSGEVIAATPVEARPSPILSMIRFHWSSASAAALPRLSLRIAGGRQPHTWRLRVHQFRGKIIKPLDFYTVCIIDNPLSMAPFQPPVTADLTVFAGNDWRYRFSLKASVNHLIIRGGYQYYTFLLERGLHATEV